MLNIILQIFYNWKGRYTEGNGEGGNDFPSTGSLLEELTGWSSGNLK